MASPHPNYSDRKLHDNHRRILELNIAPQLSQWMHRKLVRGEMEFETCTQAWGSTNHPPLLFSNVIECSRRRKRFRLGIFSRRFQEVRATFENSTTEELMQYLGDSTAGWPSTESPQECKLLTLQGDKLMCRLAEAMHGFVLYAVFNKTN